MSEVPTREKVADLIEQLERMHPLDGLAPWTTAPIDLLPMLRLALSALDAQEAAGEGVTEAMVKKARNAMREAFPRRTPPTLDEVRAALLAVHPAIFAAGERAGLEKAAVWLERESFTNGPATDAAAAIIDRFRTDAPENDAAPTIDVAEFALFDAAKHIATAIRSLKGGTP